MHEKPDLRGASPCQASQWHFCSASGARGLQNEQEQVNCSSCHPALQRGFTPYIFLGSLQQACSPQLQQERLTSTGQGAMSSISQHHTHISSCGLYHLFRCIQERFCAMAFLPDPWVGSSNNKTVTNRGSILQLFGLNCIIGVTIFFFLLKINL